MLAEVKYDGTCRAGTLQAKLEQLTITRVQ